MLNLPNNIIHYRKTDSTIDFETNLGGMLFETKSESFLGFYAIILLVLAIPIGLYLPIFDIDLGKSILIGIVFGLFGIIFFIVYIKIAWRKAYFHISSSGIKITSDDKKRGEIVIEPYNISDIYITTDLIGRYDKYKQSETVYTVYLKFKKEIFLPISKEQKDKLNLFGNIDSRYKDILETIVKDIKSVINLSEQNFDENNNITNFEIDDIKFEKSLDNIKIIASGDSFFATKFISTWVFIALIISFTLGFVSLVLIFERHFLLALVFGLIITLLIISIIPLHIGKTLFILNSEGIHIETKKKSFFIPIEEIEDIYKWVEYEEHYKNKGIKERIVYYTIMLKCKNEIFLAPIRKSYKQKFNMFGNIKNIHKDSVDWLIKEMKQILKLGENKIKQS